MSPQLDRLYAQLSDLRSKQRRGQNVKSEIERVLAEINRLEQPAQQTSMPSPQPRQNHQTSNIDFSTQGNAVGNAVGPGAEVNADIITGNYQQQNFNQTTYQNQVISNSSPYGYSPTSPEAAAAEIVSGIFSRVFWQAPRAVAVSLLTISPVFAIFSPKEAAIGFILLLTVTPIGAYVLWKTKFFKIPDIAYRDNKLLFYSAWALTGIGILAVILAAIGFYFGMAVLSAVTGSMRDQIRRF